MNRACAWGLSGICRNTATREGGTLVIYVHLRYVLSRPDNVPSFSCSSWRLERTPNLVFQSCLGFEL
jgi:hypothetical protein